MLKSSSWNRKSRTNRLIFKQFEFTWICARIPCLSSSTKQRKLWISKGEEAVSGLGTHALQTLHATSPNLNAVLPRTNPDGSHTITKEKNLSRASSGILLTTMNSCPMGLSKKSYAHLTIYDPPSNHTLYFCFLSFLCWFYFLSLNNTI